MPPIYSTPTGSAPVHRRQHQTASPGLSKELPDVFLSCTGVWHGEGTLGGQTKSLVGSTGSLQKPPASFQFCSGAPSSFANLLLKWLLAFLREVSVCRSTKLPPLSLPAVGGSLQPPCLAPHAGTRRGRGVLPLHPNPRSHPLACSHTHGHPHTEECAHKDALHARLYV